MGSLIHQLRQACVVAVDGSHGEMVRIVPKKKDQFTGDIDDPARAPVDIVAKLHRQNAAGKDLGFRGDRPKAMIGSGQSQLHIDRAKLPDGYVIKAGDMVIALERGGQDRFRVSLPDDRALSRLVLDLSPAGSVNA